MADGDAVSIKISRRDHRRGGAENGNGMEEILVLILQFLLELGLELLGSCDFFDFFPTSSTTRKAANETDGCIGFSFAFMLAGALCGLLVNAVHSKMLIPFAWLRIVNLCAAPLLSGGLSYYIAVRRRERAPHINPWTRFWFGFSYTLAFVVIRFAYGTR